MSLTKEEKITLITKLEERFDLLHKLLDQANCTGIPTSELGNAIYAMQDAAITYAAALVEDDCDWLDWYFYEAKRTGLNSVKIGKIYIKVKDIPSLVRVIDWDRDHKR